MNGQKAFDPASLVHTLKENENIFLCGPSFGKSHLRVYAYGGLLCQIPTRARAEKYGAEIDLKGLPGYLEYAGESRKELLNLLDAFNKKLEEASDSSRRNHLKAELLTNGLELILLAMRNKYTPKKARDEEDGKERRYQTIISRNHLDFGQHNGVVICDFESCIPQSWFMEAARMDPAQAVEPKTPRFDMVTFSWKDDQGELSLVELKCAASTCRDRKSGLKVHARDMLLAERLGEKYKKELLRRFQIMASPEFSIFQGIPAELKKIFKDPGSVALRKCFLFTQGPGIHSPRHPDKGAAALCLEEGSIGKEDVEKFCYQFSETPQGVDLSKMQTWAEFSR